MLELSFNEALLPGNTLSAEESYSLRNPYLGSLWQLFSVVSLQQEMQVTVKDIKQQSIPDAETLRGVLKRYTQKVKSSHRRGRDLAWQIKSVAALSRSGQTAPGREGRSGFNRKEKGCVIMPWIYSLLLHRTISKPELKGTFEMTFSVPVTSWYCLWVCWWHIPSLVGPLFQELHNVTCKHPGKWCHLLRARGWGWGCNLQISFQRKKRK